MAMLWQMREKRNRQATTVLINIRTTRMQSLTDARDKVCSVLRLARDTHCYPTPDYRNTVEQVYADTARNVVTICIGDIGLLLAEAGKQRQQLALPSWVPNWSYRLNMLSFCDVWYRRETDGTV